MIIIKQGGGVYKGGPGAETSAYDGEDGGKKQVTYNFQHARFVL